LGKSNQAARKGTGPSKLATKKSNEDNAIHAQKNIQNRNMLILIIFSTHIQLDTTGHQMAIQFPTSPNICFCSTREKQNKQNITFLFNAISLFD